MNDNGTPEKAKVASVQADENPQMPDVEAETQGGLAAETQGREDSDLYENDVFGRIAKRRKEDIWARGNEKRIRHGSRRRTEEEE